MIGGSKKITKSLQTFTFLYFLEKHGLFNGLVWVISHFHEEETGNNMGRNATKFQVLHDLSCQLFHIFV